MKRPLSEELRPAQLADFFGQDHVLGEQALFPSLLKRKTPLSLLFWGPPGCGKTTLAKIYMQSFVAKTFFFHPVSQSITEIKKWVQEIQSAPLFHTTNLLFIDEIHRMNKAQQDCLLPLIEEGIFILVGATTENPSFSLNDALLSRIRVLQLKTLTEEALHQILDRALHQKKLIPLSQESKNYLVQESKGDARHLLNCVENLFDHPALDSLTPVALASLLSSKQPLYDKSGDGHFSLISALHKSIRGSDPDASLYWFCRMLEGGEDLHYVARRLVRLSIEDIGLADPQAQRLALDTWQTYERLGSPEGDLALAELVLFLALSPKSNAAYKAFNQAKEHAKKTSHLPPPPTIINASNSFMKSQGYGKDYLYDHDVEGGFSGQNYFPTGLKRESFYEPKEIGLEREMKKRKEFFQNKREKK